MLDQVRRLFRPGGPRSDISRVLALLWLVVLIGSVSLVIPGWAQYIAKGWVAALTVIGAGLYLAGAACVTGSLVGFMFGVPRYRTRESGSHVIDGKTTAPNTNLEQISDWLTKIIVGVGLTQLPAIGRFFEQLGDRWGSAFGMGAAGPLIAIAITIHYLVVGFFQGFLLSSLWLPAALERAQEQIRAHASPSGAETNNPKAIGMEGGSSDLEADVIDE
jgi:hypothetical protein